MNSQGKLGDPKQSALETTGGPMEALWYALHIRPRFEKYVEIHLREKGYEVFLPTYVSKRRWSDRVKSLTVPLFPGYLFCKFDLRSRLPILVTPSVNFIVGAGRAPIPVDPDEITAVHRVIDSGLATQPWPYLQSGDRVRIESGPLDGLTGIVVRTKTGDRLVLSVSLLMRSVSVEVDRSKVKPLDSRICIRASGELTPSR